MHRLALIEKAKQRLGGEPVNSSVARLPENSQSILADQFLYFFLRVRKSRIRKVVEALNASHADETIEQRAQRLIAAQTSLSFLGGALLHLPMLLPGLGQALKLIGFVGGASVLTRMHLYLILEIALLYGKDIDDHARVPEMAAVVLGSGLAAGTPFLIDALDIHPVYSLPAAGLTAFGVAKLIGESAIHFYGKEAAKLAESPAPAALNAAS